jgi:hypothetical protein
MQNQSHKSECYELFHAAPHMLQKGMPLDGSASGVGVIRPATIGKLESQRSTG